MAGPGADQLDPGKEHVGGGTERAKETDRGIEAASDKAERLADRAREGAAELKRQAERTADDVRQRVRSAADEQKNAAAERVGGVARALRAASDDLRDQGQPMVAEYSGYVAEGLESFADTLGRRDVDGLVEDVEDFARTRPVAFLGGAVVAGFALARFMKSSAARRQRRTDRSPSRSATAGAAATPAGGTTTPGPWPPGTAAPGAGGYGQPEKGAL